MADDTLGNACSAFSAEEIQELRSIARSYLEAGGVVEKIAAWAGQHVSKLFGLVPEGWHDQMNHAADLALRLSYAAAETTQPTADPETWVNRAKGMLSGERSHRIATAVSGAIGGVGGLATTAGDMVVTTTLILRSIQQIAIEYGEDITDEEVRLQCLGVFGFGGPLTEDDGVETGLYSIRLALRQKVLVEVVKAVLPRFGIVMSEKALAQAAPILGAVAGAAINPTFTSYYQQMAHVHFRLRKLEKSHPADEVSACFERIVQATKAAKANPKGRSSKA
jgi:hypothetical protein